LKGMEVVVSWSEAAATTAVHHAKHGFLCDCYHDLYRGYNLNCRGTVAVPSGLNH
jgi:hypothetical protein